MRDEDSSPAQRSFGAALTKTVWFGPTKQVLRVIGIKLTKDSFAKAASKAVPLAGGFISGGLTYATLRLQSARFIRHLRELPPPGVYVEKYLEVLHQVDVDEEERKGTGLRGRMTTRGSKFARRSASKESDVDATDEPESLEENAGCPFR